MSRYDIAIIGMGCVFPSANSPEVFWQNILSGKSYFKEMPKELWRLDNYYSHDRSRSRKCYTKVGAFIEDFRFPAEKYKLPPNTFKGLDQTQLVTLEATRQALIEAGIEPRSKTLETGVTIMGTSGVDAVSHISIKLRRHRFFGRLKRELLTRGVSQQRVVELEQGFERELTARGHVWEPAVSPSNGLTASVSNRVAQVFGVRGFNMTVDGACASSFVALDMACQALISGDARIALAGGVDLGTNPAVYVGFSQVDALSSIGQSNPFDHGADGLVIGEGAGVVVLKRLEDALAEGDKVQAVIRGIGSSSDGAGQAIYAPSVKGRTTAIMRALDHAETRPEEVQYLEAHATSTVVGDANEYDTISSVYGDSQKRDLPLYLGSVKGQIGHLKAGAGIAGLIKTILAMENGTIPHMPRFEKLTPHAEKPNDQLVIPTRPLAWQPNDQGIRIAAVTASGFGGVNYHIIIEQADRYAPPPPERPKLSREIAIVGAVSRTAGAEDIEVFWENITQAKPLFSKADPEELGWQDHMDAGPEQERITTRMVSRIKRVEVDLLRHKIFPNAVSQIAPTQFLGLDLADQLLKNSGMSHTEQKRIGVSLGAMHDDYFPEVLEPMVIDEWADAIRCCPESTGIPAELLEQGIELSCAHVLEQTPPVSEHTLPGWMGNVIAGRIANKLNLNGPNFTVDSGFSSGLAAFIPAIYQLMYGDVDLMICGGLNQQLSDVFTCGICATGMTAEWEGRPFDAHGDGFLIGEGGAMFLLKRLDDAIRDKDNVIAVVRSVSGSSETNSGAIPVISEEGLRRAMTSALKNTSISKRDIGIVDAHGAANSYCDIIEAHAIANELRPDGNEDLPVQITAASSHLGQLYGGTAAISMLSIIQSLKNRTAPGIRNLSQPRPEIASIAPKARPQYGTDSLSHQTKAGAVNSLGFGGGNYFAILTLP